MNSLSVFVSHLRAKRKLLAAVCCTLLCVGAILLAVLSRGGRSEMRPRKVNVYGTCPECRRSIEAELERLHPDRIWDSSIWGENDRLSPRGRRLFGVDYVLDCPICGAKISAAVEFYGKRTRQDPYGEHTRVWGLNSEAAREALIQSLSGKTNLPSALVEVPVLTMTNGVGNETIDP